MEKKEAREKVKERLAALSATDTEGKANDAIDRLLALLEFQQSETVMMFFPLKDEIDVTRALDVALADGKTVVVPKTLPADKRLAPCKISSTEKYVSPGAYGILEPEFAEEVTVESIDFVLVPARAFDKKGNRLGRGAGYYDRFMSQPAFRAVMCGIAYAEQVFAELPHAKHDVPIDLLITNEEILRFTPGL